MSQESQEIAALRAEVAGLRAALANILAMNVATGEAVQALCLMHSDPMGLHKALDEMKDAADAHLLFSQGTEENLRAIEEAREAVRMPLKVAAQRRSQTP